MEEKSAGKMKIAGYQKNDKLIGKNLDLMIVTNLAKISFIKALPHGQNLTKKMI